MARKASLRELAEQMLRDMPDVATVMSVEELVEMLPDLIRESHGRPLSLGELVKTGFKEGKDRAFAQTRHGARRQLAEKLLRDNPDIAAVLSPKELEAMLPSLLREARQNR